ncbi:MAG: hypothetical protein ACN4GW_21335 [Desulforhopalus sp.]
MTFDNLIWLLLLVAVVFMMTRKGGCCGGRTNEPSTDNKNKEEIR